jgi:hypothetical protein
MLAPLICALAWTLAASAGPTIDVAQERASDRLAVFEGNWTREDAVPPVTFRQTCAWLAGGRRHMVCSARVQRATGTAEEAIWVASSRATDATFVVYWAPGSGPAMTYTGGPDGDRLIFNLESPSESRRRMRIVVTPSANALRFVEESSENGGPWRVTEDYKYVRVAAGAK